ncbi:hypothetical protein WICMUC_003396 [Wickerhamomyces mucosus]|uniref:non-specific serine/threonine protein kinase n=1 Tax=Wickerhamomyces mucosus TaxID=1378264 RepID=A0A9P8PN98_9ASCO|nr:hypothetical protein WICMUC_003396 [Wickerhamomyces mucosus]
MSYHSRQPSVTSTVSSSLTNIPASNINKIGPWKLGKTLGTGSTGRVLLAEHQQTGQKAAVKIVSKSKLNNSNNEVLDDTNKGRDAAGLAYGIEREIIIMKLLNHPNVLRLYDVWETSKYLYLILEYVEGGELFDLLVERGPLDEYEAIKYFRQIIMGISYCHALGICHRDLKPENLLLDHDLNIKLADFGMAALENNDRLLETSCGSPHYAAPEIVSGKHYHGFESDVWSCGVILFALLTGRLPFDDENIRSLLLKVQSGTFEMPSSDEISIEAQDLLSKMLTVDPSKRIKTHEILNHKLLQNYPISKLDQETLINLPSPNSYLKQINSIKDIDEQILKNLIILWHGVSKNEIIENLLKPESTTEKIFYFLLLRYRHNQSNSSLVRSLSIARSIRNNGSNQNRFSISNSNSNSSSVNRTPKRANRRSVISASSSHRKSVSFNTKRRSALYDSPSKEVTHSPPAVPKNLMQEFQKSQRPLPKSVSKRRSLRASYMGNKRSSITSKLIAVYAKLSSDNDWVYIDKEAKRTSSDFATLCDEIFDHEKYEQIRLEKLQKEEELRAQREAEIQEKLRILREEEEAKEVERKKLELEAERKAAEESQAAAELENDVVEIEEEEEDDFNFVNTDDKLTNVKIRSISGPNKTERNNKLLNKDEISKIQQRATTNPLQNRPKSRLDPGLNFTSDDWKTTKVYYDEDDNITKAIRRSKFLGSKFELNLKKQSNIDNNKISVDKNGIEEIPIAKKVEEDLKNYNGPKTIADVKIPNVTRKSKLYSASNKRLSVLSIYSTKNSFTDLHSKLRDLELNDNDAPNARKRQSMLNDKRQSLLNDIEEVPQSDTNTVSANSKGLRLSYADRLSALKETEEVREPDTTKEISKPSKTNTQSKKPKETSLVLPELPEHFNPVSKKTPNQKKQDFIIHTDDELKDEPIESAPLPKKQKDSTTAVVVDNEILHESTKPNKRNNSNGSFFRKFSASSDKSQQENQAQRSSSGGFFKLFGSKPVELNDLKTIYGSKEIFDILERLLMSWKNYGLKNINADQSKLTINGEISKANLMNYNSTKFKITVHEIGKKSSLVSFEKLKGSNKSFKTLYNEIERIFNRENVLAFNN